jgi:hypothetical protein
MTGEVRPGAGKSNETAAALTDEDRIALFRTMAAIREFEEQVQRRYLEGLVHVATSVQRRKAICADVAKGADDYVAAWTSKAPSPNSSAGRPPSAAGSAAHAPDRH